VSDIDTAASSRWVAVTRHPTAEWLAQQIVEAFPWDTAPRYLIRDNDGAYARMFAGGLQVSVIDPSETITPLVAREPFY
jgi:hypothetical protein